MHSTKSRDLWWSWSLLALATSWATLFNSTVSSVSLTYLPISLLWVGPCPNMGLVNGHREALGFPSGNPNQKVSLGLSTLLAQHYFPSLVFLLNDPLTSHSGPIPFQPPNPDTSGFPQPGS